MVLSQPLPYLCSVCGELFTSKAEKATPRHHCSGDFLGKAGVGEPAPDHPEYSPPPEPLGGDVELDMPEDIEPTGIPTVNIEDIAPKKTKKKPVEKVEKTPVPDTPATQASDARAEVLHRAVLAMFAGDLDRETTMLLIAQLWGGTVDVEVQEAVKVEVPGYVYVLAIAGVSGMLMYKLWINEKRMAAMERKAGSPPPMEASESW